MMNAWQTVLLSAVVSVLAALGVEFTIGNEPPPPDVVVIEEPAAPTVREDGLSPAAVEGIVANRSVSWERFYAYVDDIHRRLCEIEGCNKWQNSPMR